MPYIFGLTILLNIVAMGYFMFFHEGLTGDSPQVQQAKTEIVKTVIITKAN